jgi:septation ring formation regulator EzrA
VEIEEPVSKKMQNYDILDDALYTISKAQIQASQAANKNQLNKIARQKTEAAAQWDKEEEQIRRKLERSNINMMKQRVMQQNRQDQGNS